MTDFLWTATSGDFDDPENWLDVNSGQSGVGTPGAGDHATINGGGTVTADGDTVASLLLDSGTLSGDITVTGALTGNNTGASVLGAGIVKVGSLSNIAIDGATVTADSAGGPTDTIRSGSLAVTTIALQTASLFFVADGSVTAQKLDVAGASNATIGVGEGDSGPSGGGALTLSGNLSLVVPGSSAFLTTFAGATTTIEGNAVVDVKIGGADNDDLVADGGTLAIDGSLVLGQSLTGDLNVVAGGTADLGASGVGLVAGRGKGSQGNVHVDGAGSRLTVAGAAEIGGKGGGNLQVLDGGQATVRGIVAIGEDRGGFGSATVSGTAIDKTTHRVAPSHLAYGTIEVGAAGSGTLEIDNGATVAVAKGGHGVVEIAADKGSVGRVTVTGGGSMLNGRSLAVGGTVHAAGGAGTLTIAAAAAVTFATAEIWKGDKVAITGGTLHVTGALGGNGTIGLGKHGTLVLGGHDAKVAVSFAAGSSGALLHLGGADHLGAAAVVKGFTKGDGIRVDGLDEHATFAVHTKSADTVVTLSEGGHKAGSLVLAGHFTKAGLHLAHGELTTSASGAAAAVGAAAPADADSFVFNHRPGTVPVVTITGFASGTDRIAVDHAAFAGLGDDGTLAASHFAADARGVAHTAAQHVVYDTTDGALFYDPDGSGHDPAVQFATLTGHPALHAADFLVT